MKLSTCKENPDYVLHPHEEKKQQRKKDKNFRNMRKNRHNLFDSVIDRTYKSSNEDEGWDG